MCLLAMAWRAHADFPLLVVANRDEAYDRPSAILREWDDAPGIYGGRDLRDGGSWLALSRAGRFAAVTNVREPSPPTQPRSRGALVREFVLTEGRATAEALRATDQGADFRPFNLILWDGHELVHATNRPQPARLVFDSGVHGVSNGNVGERWPKVRWAVDSLRSWLAALPAGEMEPDVAPLFAAMASEQRAHPQQLPQTGVGPELELRLSAPFIRGDVYGTRATTVVMVRRDGVATLIERSFNPGGTLREESRLTVQLERSAARGDSD